MDESLVINERCSVIDLDVKSDSLKTMIPNYTLEELIPKESLVETTPIIDTDTIQETNNEIEKQLELSQETISASISNQETLGDSSLESISNSSGSNSLPITQESNSLPITNLNNLENTSTNTSINTSINTSTNIIEALLPDKKDSVENTDYMNNVISQSNLDNLDNLDNLENYEVKRFKIPEPEILELDKIIPRETSPARYNSLLENNFIHKSNVTFSSKDLQEIISFENNNSLNTNSEFSYTKKIKDTNQPNLFSKPLCKDIRLSKLIGNSNSNSNSINNSNSNSNNTKKKHKKQVELDEVDYLYNKLQDYSRNLTINITNYMIIITKAIEIIENYNDFTPTQGHGKKEVVIKAVNRLVMIDLDLNELDKRVFLSTLSNFIELIIMCSKRHLKDSSTTTKDNFNSKNDKIEEFILASSGQIVFSLIDKITTIIIKNQYNSEKIAHNIPTLTEILMLMADKYDYLTGLEKKNIVIQAINVFIEAKVEYVIDVEQERKKEIIEILQCVPNTIDLFIALQKQKYKINKKRIIKVKNSGCLNSIFAAKKSYEDY